MCDPYLAGVFGRKFERDGWDVYIVETLKEAEQRAVKMRPSIVLLDTGCSTQISEEIKRLRTFPTLQDSQLVVLAEQSSREDIDLARRAGASGYLIKGHFVPQEAVQKMRRLLHSKMLTS